MLFPVRRASTLSCVNKINTPVLIFVQVLLHGITECTIRYDLWIRLDHMPKFKINFILLKPRFERTQYEGMFFCVALSAESHVYVRSYSDKYSYRSPPEVQKLLTIIYHSIF